MAYQGFTRSIPFFVHTANEGRVQEVRRGSIRIIGAVSGLHELDRQ